jgi:hypothetical protein
MKKNKKKLEVINMENDEMREEILEETEVGGNKWSLKKKLLLGGGILAGLVLGAVALGRRKSANNDNEDAEDFDYDYGKETIEEATGTSENVEE